MWFDCTVLPWIPCNSDDCFESQVLLLSDSQHKNMDAQHAHKYWKRIQEHRNCQVLALVSFMRYISFCLWKMIHLFELDVLMFHNDKLFPPCKCNKYTAFVLHYTLAIHTNINHTKVVEIMNRLALSVESGFNVHSTQLDFHILSNAMLSTSANKNEQTKWMVKSNGNEIDGWKLCKNIIIWRCFWIVLQFYWNGLLFCLVLFTQSRVIFFNSRYFHP